MQNNTTSARRQPRHFPVEARFIAEAVALLKSGQRLRRGDLRANPVTGHTFAHAVDPIRRQIVDAAAALQARHGFAEAHPDLPPLPLCWNERETLKADGQGPHLGHLVSWYALSLARVGYNSDAHSSFETFVRDTVLTDPKLRPYLPADLIARFERGVSL
ncbi:MAG TPA: hypothetical protein VGG77_15075 [Roseiarcus sp.]